MEKFLNFLSGFRLASILLLLLMLLTFFGTLEQVQYGLYATINKYFTWKNVIVIPEITRINDKPLYFLPLPGAYWVCFLLFFNMFLGGILKIRKSRKNTFIVISHFGILMLLIGGFITHHFSHRGNMALYEGDSSNFAQHYHNYDLEVALLDENGLATEIFIFDHKATSKIPEGGDHALTLSHTQLPFTLKLNHRLTNSRPADAMRAIPREDTPAIDGYVLKKWAEDEAAEANYLGCYAEASTGDKFLLFSGAFTPYVINHEGKKYSVKLHKSIWKMPFTVHLDDFHAEFFPSGRPKLFESYISRIEGDSTNKVKIHMNHPMRYDGYTFFQASWGPPDGKPNDRLYTVFEVVKNPADKWPEYSIYVTTLGLLGHFIWKLMSFILRQTKKKEKV